MARQEEGIFAEYASEPFQEGFSVTTLVGIIFAGLIMMPGSIYLGLVAGQEMGPAAEWTTIILFTEIARRSFRSMRRQEVYMLFYVSGAMTTMMGGMALAGGPFASFIWRQYLIRSDAAAAFGIADQIPFWAVPAASSPAIVLRSFFHHDWLVPIGLMLITAILSKASWVTMGYTLFRLTSDVERLPFPLAPVAAQGATALAESGTVKESWRWRVFSIGAMIGLVFGFFYVGLPGLTGMILTTPFRLIPIPWVDLTQATETILPATPFGFTLDIGVIFLGFVLPFWIVLGSVAGAVGLVLINPILYKLGVLQSWHPGMNVIDTQFVNRIDFWLSVGIGKALLIAFLGLFAVVRAYIRRKRQIEARERGRWAEVPKGRGDFPIKIVLGIFLAATVAYIVLAHKLVPAFPLFFLFFFGFIFTPLNSYINARMHGYVGRGVGFPMVRQASFILGSQISGYSGAGIWFAPVPEHNYGAYAQRFREIELTRTKFTSIIKAELVMFPIIFVASLISWSFIWRLAPIPSEAYPYAQQMWRLRAREQALWLSSTVEKGTWITTSKGVFKHEGTRWYKFDHKGIFGLEADKWQRKNEEGLPADEALAVEIDHLARKWFGTSAGASRLDFDGSWEHFTAEAGLIDNRVQAILQDESKDMWFGTPVGVSKYDGRKWVSFTEADGLAGADVRDIVTDEKRLIWLATSGGLSLFNGRSWKSFTREDGLGANDVRVLVIDKQGALWCATAGGLTRFAGEKWQNFSTDDGLPSNDIRDVEVDEKGRVWMATGRGLAVFDGKEFNSLGKQDGLVSDDITSLAFDDQGMLWVGTREGLFTYDTKKGEWKSYAQVLPPGPVTEVMAKRGKAWLFEAIKWPYIFLGFGFGLGLYLILSVFGLPVVFIYGFIRGIGAIPHRILPEIIGALLGRYYFAKKFGRERWRRYTPVLFAGFLCGMGLIGMGSIAMTLISKAVIQKPF